MKNNDELLSAHRFNRAAVLPINLNQQKVTPALAIFSHEMTLVLRA